MLIYLRYLKQKLMIFRKRSVSDKRVKLGGKLVGTLDHQFGHQFGDPELIEKLMGEEFCFMLLLSLYFSLHYLL